METPATQFIDSLLKELHERALDRSRDDSVQAARTILAYDIWHKRAAIYEKRCEVLNERTKSSASQPNTRHSSAPSANSAVNTDFVPTKGDPRKKKPFGAQLSPGDTDPHTGWVVPEEHICQIRKDAPENHVIAHCMLPGYKTKADLERAVYTFIDRDNRIYNELKAAQSELNVFRSERLGSITLEKREELLAGRFEKTTNAARSTAPQPSSPNSPNSPPNSSPPNQSHPSKNSSPFSPRPTHRTLSRHRRERCHEAQRVTERAHHQHPTQRDPGAPRESVRLLYHPKTQDPRLKTLSPPSPPPAAPPASAPSHPSPRVSTTQPRSRDTQNRRKCHRGPPVAHEWQ